ncbi:hypothetical protein R1flu_008057 [Riccia fluitans]|uniref:Uncharacterized protein n=1 Tax=Riccia fluitans TaxID=41844 RepID=A0ABD1YDP4_9MARC
MPTQNCSICSGEGGIILNPKRRSAFAGRPILDSNSSEELCMVVRFFDLISTAVEPPSLLQIEEVVEASDSDEQDKGNSACRRICLESETAGPEGFAEQEFLDEANARITCQYFPIQRGKESLQTVLEEMSKLNRGASVTFETMHRVVVRWLGRLLPEVKWQSAFLSKHTKYNCGSGISLCLKLEVEEQKAVKTTF